MIFKGFQLDTFQEIAIGHIDKQDSVLVSAPTGAGKTVIAEYAVEHSLQRSKTVIYTAPIKALSNQKFREFTTSYGADVGIITGDVTLNANAPILIMTTEIFRNTIFDNPQRLENVGHVIFDEIHYLDDFERGTVWEESIILAPQHVRLVCLSATIPNIDQIAGWMRSIRSEFTAIVEEKKRPVPLHHYFHADGEIFSNIKHWKKIRQQGRQGGRSRQHRGRRGRQDQRQRPDTALIEHIQKHEQLTCLYFVFNRKRCQALADHYHGTRLLSAAQKDDALQLFDKLIQSYGLAPSDRIRRIRGLVQHGVAYHHAGLLPSMKEVIERLFTAGHIRLIFATSTFALGINMPARTVVIDELNSFNGVDFSDMTVRSYYQMAGRAGRRGMDKEGIVYANLDARHITPARVDRIVNGRPEPVNSQLNTCYATILNLVKRAAKRIYEVYERSFHYFLASDRERQHACAQIDRKLKILRHMGYIKDDMLTERGSFAANLYGYELQGTEFLFQGLLDDLQPADLAVLAMASVYDGRSKESTRDQAIARRISGPATEIVKCIRSIESSCDAMQLTATLNFALSTAARLWVDGCPFDELTRATGLDEGEIVRNLRRAMQLLREIREAVHDRSDLKARLSRTIDSINRDVVDPEKQMLAGC